MTNGEKLEQVFPDGICPFSKKWLDCEYKKSSLSSALEKNSKKLENVSPVIDWNNCHTSEQLDSIATTKNDLGVDKEQLKTMIRGLTKWYVKRDNTEVGEPNTAVGLLYDDVMFGIDRLPSVTPQPRKGHWEHGKELSKEYRGRILVDVTYADWHCSNCHCVIEESIKPKWNFCPNCGAKMQEVEV